MSYPLDQFILRNILWLQDVSRSMTSKTVSGLLRYHFDIIVKLVLILTIAFFPPFFFFFVFFCFVFFLPPFFLYGQIAL